MLDYKIIGECNLFTQLTYFVSIFGVNANLKLSGSYLSTTNFGLSCTMNTNNTEVHICMTVQR